MRLRQPITTYKYTPRDASVDEPPPPSQNPRCHILPPLPLDHLPSAPENAKVGTAIINPKGLNAVGGVYPDEVYANFPVMLRKLATIYAVVSAVGALGIRPPPAAPKTGKNNGNGKVAKGSGLSLGQALKDRKFWLLWFMVRNAGGRTSGQRFGMVVMRLIPYD